MITEIGKYFIFLRNLFINRESFRTYYKLVLEESVSIGIGSLFLVALVATFMTRDRDGPMYLFGTAPLRAAGAVDAAVRPHLLPVVSGSKN